MASDSHKQVWGRRASEQQIAAEADAAKGLDNQRDDAKISQPLQAPGCEKLRDVLKHVRGDGVSALASKTRNYAKMPHAVGFVAVVITS